mgnify:CR=1 FL=1
MRADDGFYDDYDNTEEKAYKHLIQIKKSKDELNSDELSNEELKQIESIDNCFSDIDYRVYLPIEEGVIPQQEKKLTPLYQ